MKTYILIILGFIVFNLNGQVKYDENGEAIVVDADPIIFDTLESNAIKIGFWESRKEAYLSKIESIERKIQELRKEGGKRGDIQRRLDYKFNGVLAGLTEFNGKDIKIEVNPNTYRIRCMEIIDTTITYEEREVSISPDPDSMNVTETVIDTLYEPVTKSMGRIKMKSEDSFEFKDVGYYRKLSKTRNENDEVIIETRWVRRSDKKIYFR